MSLFYYIVDVETTGLDSNKHEVNEVSIIRCLDRVQLTQFIKCDYPERASYDALKITRKTLADLDKGVSKEDATSKIDKFLLEDGGTKAHRCFIGHNVIAFDKKFMHTLYEKVNKELQVDLWLDTLQMIKFYAKENNLKEDAKKQGKKLLFNLHAACDILGIKKLSEAHSSKVDTRNNYLLYRNLVEDKKIDYLPFIKSYPHILTSAVTDDDGLDPDLLDI